MTESEAIIEILTEISRGNGLLYNPFVSLYIQTIKAHGLIIADGKTYHISRDGYEVLKLRSFDKWLANKEKKEAELHQATLNTAKATVDAANSAKWSQYAAFIAAIAAVAAILIPLLTSDNKPSEKKSDPMLRAMQDKLDKLDSLVKIQQKSRSIHH